MPIRCEIVSQDRLVFEGDVDIVVAPGVEGEMGILPDHAPLLTTLRHGMLRVRHHNREEVFAISGGFMEVQPDVVTVLADAAEHSDEIDVARAQEARSRAEEALKNAPKNTQAYIEAEMALRRSDLRLGVARRRSGRAGAPPASEGPR